MRKSEFLEKVNNYTAYAQSENRNSGANGTSYEMSVKLALGNYKGQLKSKAGVVDTRKGGYSIEVKSGCGELATLDENGKIINTVFKRDIIIYSPFYEAGDDVFQSSYVLTTEDFFKALEEARLIRTKVSSAMNKKKQNGEAWYYDRMSIQSFKNSQKATNRWLDALETYGTDLKSWLEEL